MKKLLLIEDDSALREIYKRVFEENGWKVYEAENGKVALEMLKKCSPDIILLDILMPEKDGFDFLRAFKEKGMKYPVVVLTNLSGEEYRQKTLELGARDYLLKVDFTPQELVKKVESYL
mgnify:CR=1 FL=1